MPAVVKGGCGLRQVPASAVAYRLGASCVCGHRMRTVGRGSSRCKRRKRIYAGILVGRYLDGEVRRDGLCLCTTDDVAVGKAVDSPPDQGHRTDSVLPVPVVSSLFTAWPYAVRVVVASESCLCLFGWRPRGFVCMPALVDVSIKSSLSTRNGIDDLPDACGGGTARSR